MQYPDKKKGKNKIDGTVVRNCLNFVDEDK